MQNAQRDYEIPILKDIQNLTQQGPKYPGLTESALKQRFDHMTFRSTFQPNFFYDSIDSQSLYTEIPIGWNESLKDSICIYCTCT